MIEQSSHLLDRNQVYRDFMADGEACEQYLDAILAARVRGRSDADLERHLLCLRSFAMLRYDSLNGGYCNVFMDHGDENGYWAGVFHLLEDGLLNDPKLLMHDEGRTEVSQWLQEVDPCNGLLTHNDDLGMDEWSHLGNFQENLENLLPVVATFVKLNEEAS